jgi:hypothetical protein
MSKVEGSSYKRRVRAARVRLKRARRDMGVGCGG